MNRRKLMMAAAVAEAVGTFAAGSLGYAVIADDIGGFPSLLVGGGGGYILMMVCYLHVKLAYYRFLRKPVEPPRVYGAPTKGAVLAVDTLCKTMAAMVEGTTAKGKPDSVPDDEWRDYLGTLEAFRVGTGDTLAEMRAAYEAAKQ